MPIDPCFAALLSDPRNAVRPPPAGVPLEKVRRVADAAMAQGDLLPMASVTDATINVDGRDIPIRHYRPDTTAQLPAIIFCHGGGFVWGSIDTHDGLCRRLAVRTGAAVISVGYRLAPETSFPGPVEDVIGVLKDISDRADAHGIDPQALALCGDSAGGAICVSVAAAVALVGIPLCHLGLFYPALDPTCASPSQQEFSDGPLLTRSAMEWFWACYLGSCKPSGEISLPDDPKVMSRLPPTTIALAEFDPLRDEGIDFHERLLRAGNDARMTCYGGMIHGFLSLPVLSPKIEAALDEVSLRLRSGLAYASKS